MKRLLLCLLTLALLTPADARRWVPKIAAAGGGGSYFLSDDLVYANNTAAAAAGWTNDGTPWNYSTSPAPLLGYSSSLRATAFVDDAYISFTPVSSFWCYFAFNAPTNASPVPIMELETGGGATSVIVVTVDSVSGLLTIAAGGSSQTYSYTPATTYQLWLNINSSAGTIVPYLSTSGTRGSALTTVSGTPWAASDTIWLYAYVSASSCIFNKLRMSTSAIGDNPP